jgi:hypothetical protein
MKYYQVNQTKEHKLDSTWGKRETYVVSLHAFFFVKRAGKVHLQKPTRKWETFCADVGEFMRLTIGTSSGQFTTQTRLSK